MYLLQIVSLSQIYVSIYMDFPSYLINRQILLRFGLEEFDHNEWAVQNSRYFLWRCDPKRVMPS